jgi:hypothetical protein
MTTFQCDRCETTKGVRVSAGGGTYVAPSITCEGCFSDDLLSFDDLPTTDTLSQHSVALYEHDMAQYRAEMASSEQLAGVSDEQISANIDELNAECSEPLYFLRTDTKTVKRQYELRLFYIRELMRRNAAVKTLQAAE